MVACGALEGGPPFPRRQATELCGGMGVVSLPCAEAAWPSRAPCRPAWGSLGSAAAAESQSRENPTRETSGYDVTLLGDVTAPRGVWGFLQRRHPRDCAGHQQGSRRGLQRAFTAPYVCPIGPARPRVRPARAPAGTMGRSGHRCCCSPPARAGLEPLPRQPPAPGPRVTLAAPGCVARGPGAT